MNEKIEGLLNIEQLRIKLENAGIDTRKFGTGQAKTLEDLKKKSTMVKRYFSLTTLVKFKGSSQ